ncbi:hypothetical protein [Leptospira licerasiae]|uniref:ACT domain protein n=1 Tax=Leptospira licerasiae str. MMD4847 TaxID=1049971 RepID=A0ABN0H8J7_9LEPT|nr:hypothetical protein [Leptospira licerasiae]EIE00184.1 ACT domain protein [Leptospira licerasiae serovar Varillal str. VAR 010]EJZ41851.1 ACT domain protein [Leptospira licerasiae str. MMD4847]TGM94614.1 hypothetical protein EHR05_00740 [Leptospira licerasiae]
MITTPGKPLHLSCIPRGEAYALKVNISKNEIGIIYRVTAVLYVHGWNIEEAIAETSTDGYIQDIFIVKRIDGAPMTDSHLNAIHADLHELFYGGMSVMNYLANHPEKMESLRAKLMTAPEIFLFNSEISDSTVMDLRMEDRPGILFEISQILFLFGVDILSFKAVTDSGQVRDTFLLRLENGSKLNENLHFQRLKEALNAVL